MALRTNKNKNKKNVPVDGVKSEMTEAVEELSEAVSEVVDELSPDELAEIEAEAQAELAAEGADDDDDDDDAAADAAAKKKAVAAAKKKAVAAAKKKAVAAAKKKAVAAAKKEAVATAKKKAEVKADLKARAAAEATAREPEEVPEVEEAEVVEEAQVPVVKQQASPPARTVSAKQLMKEMLYSDLEDGFIAEFGTLPRIIASNGNFLDGDNKPLGTFITGQVLSWNKRYTITPADNKAPDTLVRFSMDNKVLDDGSGVTVAEYIQELKNNNYPDACSKEYYDVIFNLMSSEQPSAHVNNMVTLQMSVTGKTNTWTIFKGSLID